MFNFILGLWALGYPAGVKIHWYTPMFCYLFGKKKIDPHNGCRVFTYKEVNLLLPVIKKG